MSHEALLTLACKVRAAADDGDPERLEQTTRRFSAALAGHLRYESAALGRMAPAEARLLKKGQGRICSLAADLLDDATRGCPVAHRDCRSRADELVALLRLQARDEQHTLEHV